MRILFFTGSRSEWGYIKPIIKLCKEQDIKYNICATNTHVLDSYGLSINEIKKDGFKVSDEIYMTLDGYNTYSSTKSLGIVMMSFLDVVQRIKPDWILLAGDRGETLIASIVAAYTNTHWLTFRLENYQEILMVKQDTQLKICTYSFCIKQRCSKQTKKIR